VRRIWKIETSGGLGDGWPTPNGWEEDKDKGEEKDYYFVDGNFIRPIPS